MNTSTAEIKLLLGEITREALKQGMVPSLLDLTGDERFKKAGTVQFFSGLNQDIAQSSEINEELDKIERNCDVLDMTAAMQTRDTVLFRDTFRASIDRLERVYRDLAYRAESLVMLSRSGTNSLYCISDTFSYLTNINLSTTTAYIDTYRGLAEIPFDVYEEEAESGVTNAIISDVKLYHGDHSEQVAFDSNMLYLKYEAEAPRGIEMEIKISAFLNNVFQGGRLEFQLDLPETTRILWVKGSSDNINFENMHYFQNNKHVFIPISNTYQNNSVIVRLQKIDHDGERIDSNGFVKHQFIFSINSLRIPNRKYRDSAVVETNAYVLPAALATKGIAQYRLSCQSIATGDTKVVPYIAWDSSNFRQVDFGKIYKLGEVSTGSTIHKTGTALREAPTPIYRLDGETKATTYDGGYLLEGFEQAEIATQEYSISAVELPFWVNNPGVLCYQGLSSSGIYLPPETANKIYFIIESDKNREITLSNIGVYAQGDVGTSLATWTYLYFNGQKVNGKILPDGSLEFRLTIIEGKNTVNMLVGISGGVGGFLVFGSKLYEPGMAIYVKERRPTSLTAVMALQVGDKAYAVDNGLIYLNYLPYVGAEYKHIYTEATTGLPAEVRLKFDLEGSANESPQIFEWKLDLTPGIALVATENTGEE